MVTLRHRHSLAAVALIGLITVVGYVAFTFVKTQRFIESTEDRLSQFLVPPITYEGRVYTFHHGRVVEPITYADHIQVLRIAQFVTSHRVHPIFAFEGLPVDEFTENFSAYKTIVEEILPFFDDVIAEQFRTSLYPNQFLASVPNLERARRTMLAEPSAESIAVYERLLESTIEAYMEDIGTLEQLVYASDQKGTQKYGFFDGVTDRATVIAALRAHAAAAHAQYERASARYTCYVTGVCSDTDDVSLYYNVERAPRATTTLTLGDYTKARELQSLNQAFHTSLWTRLSAAQPTTTTEMLALAHLKCYPGSAEILFGEFKTPFLPAYASKFEPLDDIFFYDTHLLDSGPYFAWLKDKGIRYQHHTSNAPYMCLSSGETHKRLSRMQYIRDYVRQQPLFDLATTSTHTDNSIPPHVTAELQTTERIIRESDTLNELDVYHYLENIAYALNTYGEPALSEVHGPSVLRATHLIHVWNQGAHNLSVDMAYIAYLTAQQPYILIHRKKSPAEFLYPRAYMSILFMTYNNSVIPGIPPSFIKTSGTFVPERYGYTTYRTGPLQMRSLAEVRDLITHSNIFTTTFNEIENPLPTTP